jgi:hypothetical protein
MIDGCDVTDDSTIALAISSMLLLVLLEAWEEGSAFVH